MIAASQTQEAIEAMMAAGMVSMYLDIAAAADPSNPANAREEMTDAELADAYAERNGAVFMALGFARLAGYRCGVASDPKEPKWPVVFIDLPAGQVSWHVPEYPGEYDGHSTAEKYERVAAFSDAAQRALIIDPDWSAALAPRAIAGDERPGVAPEQ